MASNGSRCVKLRTRFFLQAYVSIFAGLFSVYAHVIEANNNNANASSSSQSEPEVPPENEEEELEGMSPFPVIASVTKNDELSSVEVTFFLWYIS